MMNCDQTRLRLASYLDGESPQSERDKIEEHLRDCAECREELEALRRTIKLTGTWTVDGTPDLWSAISDVMDNEVAAQMSIGGDHNAALIVLLQDMQREIRDLRSEVADLRSELSGRIGSLSMRTRTPVSGNELVLPGVPLSQPQRLSVDIERRVNEDPKAANLEITRLTGGRNPWRPRYPVKLEEEDLWSCDRS